ncbi:MAG: hypothetical protein SNG35_02195 [Rikenellaceae bacterium]
MKKIITTLAITVALHSLPVSMAQSMNDKSCGQPSPEAQLLSSTHVDGATVTKWLVKGEPASMNSEFYVRYQINLSNLSPSFADNAAELNKLSEFIASVDNDELKRISSIDIVGYASPDGVKSQNEELAQKRAVSLRNYISKHCSSVCCNGETKGVALPWSDIEKPLESSRLESKESLIQLVEGNQKQSIIEAKLREGRGWDYIKNTILPKMRYVDVTINYDNYKVVVTRTPDVAVEMVEIERDKGATVAYVEEMVIANSPYDNKPPKIVEEQSYIIVIDHSARSSAEFVETSYPLLDY